MRDHVCSPRCALYGQHTPANLLPVIPAARRVASRFELTGALESPAIDYVAEHERNIDELRSLHADELARQRANAKKIHPRDLPVDHPTHVAWLVTLAERQAVADAKRNAATERPCSIASCGLLFVPKHPNATRCPFCQKHDYRTTRPRAHKDLAFFAGNA